MVENPWGPKPTDPDLQHCDKVFPGPIYSNPDAPAAELYR
jgi:hypothetical protein